MARILAVALPGMSASSSSTLKRPPVRSGHHAACAGRSERPIDPKSGPLNVVCGRYGLSESIERFAQRIYAVPVRLSTGTISTFEEAIFYALLYVHVG